MFKKSLIMLFTFVYLLSISEATNCFAKENSSIFNYGFRGLCIGAITGASAGYIRYSDDNDSSSIGRSTAYGALIGAGLGLVAGISDIYGSKSCGDLLIKDMNIGGEFGAAIGLIWGGIDALNKNETKNLGKSVAWGYLGGIILGAGVAIYQSTDGCSDRAQSCSKVKQKVAFIQDSNLNTCPGWQLIYNF